MKKLRLLKANVVSRLTSEIDQNLERYRSGNFEYLVTDQSTHLEIESLFNDEKIVEIQCAPNNHKEIECCVQMYESMKGIQPYLARDARLWVYLTHTLMLSYTRSRWPIPSDHGQAIAHIKMHFFANGTRGIERDNAASRLWWMASLCNRVQGLTLAESLNSFLHQYDVRANIIERPTTSQSVPVFSALIKELDASFKGDKKLFERARFRALMKALNLRAGVTLLGALSEEEIAAIVNECAG
jgi:Family of unknown function (DUF6339)